MGPEAKVHNWLKKEILKEFPTAYIYKPRAGTYGKRGVADFLCGIYGLFIAIEIKADITKEVTKSQQIELEKVIAGNNLGYVLFGKDEVMLKKIFTDIKIKMNLIV